MSARLSLRAHHADSRRFSLPPAERIDTKTGMALPRRNYFDATLRLPLWARCLLALPLMAGAHALQVVPERLLGPMGQFLPFEFLGIVVAALCLGVLPGATAVVVATLTSIWSLPPEGFFAVSRPADIVAVALNGVLGAGVVVLSEAHRRSVARERAAFTELDRRARELEAEVRQRTRAERELREANERLDEFSHAVAHDLKEPLRGITYLATFLEEDTADRLTPDERHRLGRLKASAQGMAHMLGVALDYARESAAGAAEPGESGPAVVDPAAVAGRVVQTLEPWLKQENAEVIVRGPLPPVRCDEASIIRVFTNLIANGVKYNRSSPKVIEVGVLDMGVIGLGASVDVKPPVFYVRDNGAGIPREKRDRVFRMFRRPEPGDPHDPPNAGTGAGLALTRRIIERHRGRIWIEDPPPGVQGTTFCFTLAERG